MMVFQLHKNAMVGPAVSPPLSIFKSLARGEGKKAPLINNGKLEPLPHLSHDRETARSTPIEIRKEPAGEATSPDLNQGCSIVRGSIIAHINGQGKLTMKTIIASLFASAIIATPLMAAPNLPCNPAVQNWANGSGDTCPDFGAGAQKDTPRAVRHKPKDDTGEESA